MYPFQLLINLVVVTQFVRFVTSIASESQMLPIVNFWEVALLCK